MPLSGVQPGYMQCATLIVSSVHSGLKASPTILHAYLTYEHVGYLEIILFFK